MTPRVPLPRDEDLNEEARSALGSLPPLHVFRMMANAPASFQPFLALAAILERYGVRQASEPIRRMG